VRSSAYSSAKSSDDGVTSTELSRGVAEFEQHFEQLVGPKLVGLVTAYAYMVQVGVCDFSDAVYSVWGYARRMGAGFLPEAAADAVLDWISDELVARIDDPPGEGVLSPAGVEILLRWRV